MKNSVALIIITTIILLNSVPFASSKGSGSAYCKMGIFPCDSIAYREPSGSGEFETFEEECGTLLTLRCSTSSVGDKIAE